MPIPTIAASGATIVIGEISIELATIYRYLRTIYALYETGEDVTAVINKKRALDSWFQTKKDFVSTADGIFLHLVFHGFCLRAYRTDPSFHYDPLQVSTWIERALGSYIFSQSEPNAPSQIRAFALALGMITRAEDSDWHDRFIKLMQEGWTDGKFAKTTWTDPLDVLLSPEYAPQLDAIEKILTGVTPLAIPLDVDRSFPYPQDQVELLLVALPTALQTAKDYHSSAVRRKIAYTDKDLWIADFIIGGYTLDLETELVMTSDKSWHAQPPKAKIRLRFGVLGATPPAVSTYLARPRTKSAPVLQMSKTKGGLETAEALKLLEFLAETTKKSEAIKKRFENLTQ